MAFEHCSSLYSINYDGKMSRLPSSVTVIGEDAFRDCPLLNMLYLPRSISFMDEGVFYGDINLIANVERNSYAAEYCEQNGVTYTYPDSLDWLSN